MEKRRVYLIDNIRALMIILVVLGHTIIRFPFEGSDYLYYVIFSFHMPAMIFLSGLCYRKYKTNVWRTTVLPYMVFHVIISVYRNWENGTVFTLQFTKPAWTMWYLLALVEWQMITNLIDLRKQGRAAIALSIVAALLIGYEKKVGTFLTFSRTMCFLPFFLTGAYIREMHYDKFLDFCQRKRNWRSWCIVLAPAAITQGLLYLQQHLCKSDYFMGSGGYGDGYTVIVRFSILLTAAAAIVALCVCVPDKKLPLISYIGRNTLPVYLLHGVLVSAAAHFGWLDRIPVSNVIRSAVVTGGLVVLLVSPPVVSVFQFLFVPKKKTDAVEAPKLK